MFFEYICKNYYVTQDLTDDWPIFVAQSVAQQKSSELMITDLRLGFPCSFTMFGSLRIGSNAEPYLGLTNA